MSRVYTGGTFDLFHYGHVNLLKECRKVAQRGGRNEVVVSLNTDEFIEEFKGKRPVMTYDERAAVLRACRYVDWLVPNFGGADSKPAIERVRPDFIIVGDDWADRDYYTQMQFTPEWLEERNIELIYASYTQGVSTTEIRKRVCG